MTQCPKCKRYMRMHLAYQYSLPYIWYDCECGYNTKNTKVANTNNTVYDRDIQTMTDHAIE